MIGAIEAAIAARIKAASDEGVLGYALRHVGTYAAQLDDDLARIAPQMPAVWVVLNELGRRQPIAGGWETPATFAVIVATRNLRNEQATRHGGAAGEVGSYQIVMDVRALLADQTLGLDIEPLVPGRVTSLFNGRVRDTKASIYACEVLTAFSEEAVPDAEDLDDFETFHADWDIPPHGNVEAPLPAADADASDTVTLETA